MAALRCTDVYAGAWLPLQQCWQSWPVLPSTYKGLTNLKPAYFFFRLSAQRLCQKRVSLLIIRSRRTGVISDSGQETDRNMVAGVGGGEGVAACLSPAGFFFGAWPFLKGGHPWHLHWWLELAQLESRGVVTQLRHSQCSGHHAMQLWLCLCYHTSTALPSTAELKYRGALDSASVTQRRLLRLLPALRFEARCWWEGATVPRVSGGIHHWRQVV